MTDKKLYLASGSPRRKELLAQLGYRFEIVRPDIPEQQAIGETPDGYVQRLAQEKARAGMAMTDGAGVVLGSDTIVVAGDQVLEKPRDFDHARQMLLLLSGNRHQVMTAVSVVEGDRQQTVLVTTDVWFKPLTEQEITDYWQSGEPCDKAGGYGIQGIGGRFVARIEGSYHAVVGLPMMETDQLLHQFF
jgi:septum formation protein